jgi:hypothetical protein
MNFFSQIACSKKNLERSWQKCFMFGFLLCEWWERCWRSKSSSHEMYFLLC